MADTRADIAFEKYFELHFAEKVYLKESYKKAFNEGFSEGIEVARNRAAKVLIKNNISIDTICEVTKLTKEQVHEFL